MVYQCHGAYSPCHGRCYEFYQLSSVSSRRLQWSYMDIMHNGTAFQDSMLEPYKHLCRGDTDSEAVFYFILDAINRAIKAKGRSLTKEERIPIIEERITHLVQGNMKGTLFYAQEGNTCSFMTVPVNDRQPWQQLPLNRLLVYRDGIRVYEGTDHQKEFFEEMGAPYIEALLKKIGKK